MHATLVRSVVFRFCLSIVLVSFIGLNDLFISAAWSAGELPSQKARFEGMGSTFKAKKKQAAASNSSNNTETDAAEDDELTVENDSVTYFKLHTFVVNVVDKHNEDKLVFITLEVFCEINEADDKGLIEAHIAPIKDTIITYVSGLSRDKIQTQKQKKELQKILTQRVSDVLKKLTGKKVVSELYLTRIIIQ